MHGDILKKKGKDKSRQPAPKHVVDPNAPPSAAARQAMYYGLAGLASLPLAFLLAFIVQSPLLWIILGLVWLAFVPCIVLGAWRGKFELDAITHSWSPPKGRLYATTGVIAGLAAVAANLAIIVIGIWPSGGEVNVPTTGGPLGSPEAALKTYFAAVENNKFEDYLKSLPSAVAVFPDFEHSSIKDEVEYEEAKLKFETTQRNAFDTLRKRWRDWTVTIMERREIEDKVVVLVAAVNNKKTGEKVRTDAEFRMVREGNEWKVAGSNL